MPVSSIKTNLYKNIENQAVANIIKIYCTMKKQSFTAIDEIEKYGPDAAQTLKANKAIELNNEKILFIKDWRKLNLCHSTVLTARVAKKIKFKLCKNQIIIHEVIKTMPKQYITDSEGQKISVKLPMEEYIELMEDLKDLATVAELRDDPTIPWEQVKKEFVVNGLL